MSEILEYGGRTYQVTDRVLDASGEPVRICLRAVRKQTAWACRKCSGVICLHAMRGGNLEGKGAKVHPRPVECLDRMGREAEFEPYYGEVPVNARAFEERM
jgi:hypothetical protein